MEKPKNVAFALNLLWVSLAIGVLKILIDPSAIQESSVAQTGAVIGISLFLMIFLVLNLAQGRNWARITIGFLFILGAIPAFYVIPSELVQSPEAGILTIAQIALQAYAIYLLFTHSAKVWFKKHSTHSSGK